VSPISLWWTPVRYAPAILSVATALLITRWRGPPMRTIPTQFIERRRA
jgi:hypothetical protein